MAPNATNPGTTKPLPQLPRRLVRRPRGYRRQTAGNHGLPNQGRPALTHRLAARQLTEDRELTARSRRASRGSATTADRSRGTRRSSLVTFDGDDPALVAHLERFGDTITRSHWWRAVTEGPCAKNKGCIGDGRPGRAVRLDDRLPAKLVAVDIGELLAQATDACRLGRRGHAADRLPAPDGDCRRRIGPALLRQRPARPAPGPAARAPGHPVRGDPALRRPRSTHRLRQPGDPGSDGQPRPGRPRVRVPARLANNAVMEPPGTKAHGQILLGWRQGQRSRRPRTSAPTFRDCESSSPARPPACEPLNSAASPYRQLTSRVLGWHCNLRVLGLPPGRGVALGGDRAPGRARSQ